ncbi:type 3 dihydrofolate reductase [Priestia filamentosa]|uniref:Dihydrofolate reductase n=1 Tax=Priestia filamentosa TaxID=1402861 RepID=A0A1X7F515_9BACI|nr:type 3 dihydrofolate reductase [Priestia filamentosa]AKO91717.1 dihydrofolate reductase [Priestia filamentosa]MDT3761843.1 type 3 dihydrofolate reductase [Priestia filamentosa]OXS67932.1 dihydrofolate reductase [Priestia filamentosa]RJS64865.1 type 3 dihydrofolate reductase [Priestia filamentosa]WCM16935.1 type 3 dihydrofolate reductase [Priestia filamentosa]
MISFIVAMDDNNLIGKDNALPWHLPADLAYFKKVTTNHTIVMGRKTYESIGRPLPKRKNVVLTHSTSFQEEGVTVIHSLDELKEMANHSNEELFIIGGARLYEQLLPVADRLYVTHIRATFDGDTHFPVFSKEEWKIIDSKEHKKDEKNAYDYEFVVYERS